MISLMADRVVRSLTDDLRRPPWRGSPNPLSGHCYVASEALYHLCGGAKSGLRPSTVRVGDCVHWYLVDVQGVPVDLTSGQFGFPVPYENGRGRGFLTTRPSRRAVVVIDRVFRLSDPSVIGSI